MRPIKFRAWDAKNKKYADLQTAEVYLSGHGHLFVGKTTEYGTHDDFNEYALEQFTGLTDKNGKEVFEGDIFSYKKHSRYLLDDFTALIVWIDDEAAWGYSNLCSVYPLNNSDEIQYDILNHSEVIGNIHDNPELIQ